MNCILCDIPQILQRVILNEINSDVKCSRNMQYTMSIAKYIKHWMSELNEMQNESFKRCKLNVDVTFRPPWLEAVTIFSHPDLPIMLCLKQRTNELSRSPVTSIIVKSKYPCCLWVSTCLHWLITIQILQSYYGMQVRHSKCSLIIFIWILLY